MRTVETRRTRCAVAVLALLVPVVMGGCPELRNELVNALENSTRTIVDSALNGVFDQLRTDARR